MRWVFSIALAAFCFAALAEEKLGYDDTPIIPGTPWHVHDGKRPQPSVITPPTASSNEAPGKPPSDAVVLFDGVNTSHWAGGDDGKGWKVVDGALVASKQDLISKDEFGAVHLHVEWSAPKPPKGSGQGRSNSGIFMMCQYEIQVLDSYENKTYPDGNAGAIYGQYPPLANAMVPPGEWNTFDILFVPPTFKEDKTVDQPAYVTLMHNGVLVHNHVKLLGAAAHRKLAEYVNHGDRASILIQGMNSGIRYRNIWARPLTDYDNKPLNQPEVVVPPRPDGKKAGDF
jgi:hypothetical protein